MPERLNTAGVTWKFSWDKGNGLDAGHGYGEYNGSNLWWNGNYGDNVILNFKQYQNLGAGDPLAPALNGTQIDPSGGGKEYDTNLFSQLRADVANGTLPQVVDRRLRVLRTSVVGRERRRMVREQRPQCADVESGGMGQHGAARHVRRTTGCSIMPPAVPAARCTGRRRSRRPRIRRERASTARPATCRSKPARACRCS